MKNILDRAIIKLESLKALLLRWLAPKENFLGKADWGDAALKWNRYFSPFRPSAGDIKNYEDILRQVARKEKILILGATPELRDIAARFGSEIVVVDSSQDMIEKMTKFMKSNRGVNEKRLNVDWFSLSGVLKDNYFDVILGDLVLRNITAARQEEFLDKISRLIAPGGIFIARIHFINEGLVDLSPHSIVDEAFYSFRDRKDEALEDLVVSRLFDKNTDFEKKEINKNSFFADMRDCSARAGEDRKKTTVFNNILEKWSGKATWTQRTRREMESLLQKNFAIADIKKAYDHTDAKFYPTYLLKVKEKKP